MPPDVVAVHKAARSVPVLLVIPVMVQPDTHALEKNRKSDMSAQPREVTT